MRKTIIPACICVLVFVVALWADSASGWSLIIQQGGATKGGAVIFNCSTGLTCSLSGGKVTATAAGGASTSFGPDASLPAVPATGNVYQDTDSPLSYISNGSAWTPFLFSGQTYLPEATGWSFINQGSAPAAAVDTTRGGINLTLAAVATNSIRFYSRTAISPPWTVDTGAFQSSITGAANPEVGIVMYESATGKFMWFAYQGGANSSSQGGIVVLSGTALSSGAASSEVALLAPNNAFTWLQFSYDSVGHTVTFRYSADGRNWIKVFSGAVTTYFTTAPDTYGIGVNSRNALYNIGNWLLYWNERSSAT